MSKKRLVVIMDPIDSINYQKDTTLAMLWEAQDRAYDIYYAEIADLFLRDGLPYAYVRPLKVFKDSSTWFQLQAEECLLLTQLDLILMRKDPPFDAAYLHTTHILDLAKREGVFILNDPQTLRDANEKIYASHFPEFIPPTVVTQSIDILEDFWQEQGEIVCKPLNAMGGSGIFHLAKEEINAAVIFDALTQQGSQFIMAQRFIPEIRFGDKRIILINGEPMSHALARIPQGKEWRGNIAVGARAEVRALTDRDRAICAALGPQLRARALLFVGIDVIGDYLTEINITSPTCVREIEAVAPQRAMPRLFDAIEQRFSH